MIDVITAVLDSPNLPAKFDAGKLLILFLYAERAHEDGGGAWPGLADLKRRGRMSRRQAMRWRTRLIAEGWLVKESAGTTTRPATYRVNLEKLGKPAPKKGRKPSASGGTTLVSPAVLAPSASGVTLTVVEEEPSGNRPSTGAASPRVSSSTAGQSERLNRVATILKGGNPDADPTAPVTIPARAPADRPAIPIASIQMPAVQVAWARVRSADPRKLSTKEQAWVQGQTAYRSRSVNPRTAWSEAETKMLYDIYRDRVAESYPLGDDTPRPAPVPFVPKPKKVLKERSTT